MTGEDYGYNDSDDDYVYGSEVDDDAIGMVNFVVLSMEELEKRQNDDICSISSVLSVSREVAILVLIHFNWDTTVAQDEWFRDGEQRIRESIGLLIHPHPPVSKLFNNDIVMCGICLDDFGIDLMTAAACGHAFCYGCWISFIIVSINDGPGCLTLRCPNPSCSVAIGENMMKSLSSKEDEDKYRKFLIRSYVENSKRLKWCPSPNCDFAIQYEFGNESFDVKCGCSYSFCWNCLEEIHRPVDCETVVKWNCKNINESESTNWILANSKQCPKCKKPIEKNQGCMHMTCTCHHEFCWLCMGTWSKHSLDWCNKYEKARQEGQFTEEERIRIAAKNSVEKYIHFYQRWTANEDSRKMSVVQLEQLQSEKLLQKISDVQQVFIKEVEYITKAWQQIIECRRLLKWAYAYGYYIAEEERAKKQFFEFVQGEAEVALERLHQCAEKEVLLQYADAEDPLPDFVNLKEKLCHLTEVTKDYFEKLVRALENGLVDVS